jgi:branched-chain amino acid transport system ATP-binding protein
LGIRKKMVLLSAVNLNKRYGSLTPLNNFSFELGRGEILGVIGPNGAGKTTLLNVLSGVTRPDSGKIYLERRDITRAPPHVRFNLGIGRTFQNVRPFLDLTVKENLVVSLRARKVDENHVNELLEIFKLEHFAQAKVKNCDLLVRKKTEIAKAIVGHPKLVLLDEPFAGLIDSEIEDLSSVIKNIKLRNVSFIIVEHVVRALMKLATRVIVMHGGSKIAEGTPSEIVQNHEVIRVYLGDKYVAS